MRKGASQKDAAKAEGVSQEKLRRFRELNTTSARHRGTWAIFDLRPDRFRVASRGHIREVTLTREDGSEVGAYWNAVNKFLWTNNAEHLRPFANRGVTDVNGTFHPFETRPNFLRKLDAIGELHFTEIYADVAK